MMRFLCWTDFFDSTIFVWVVMPLLIFGARVIDVTLGTIRIISIAKGYRLLAPILGFFEVLLWLFVVMQIVKNLHNPLYYIAFAAGFATGNFVGIVIEEKLAIGTLLVRTIVSGPVKELINGLREKGYGVTSVEAQGTSGKVTIIYSIIRRKDVRDVVETVEKYDPHAFYSVEDLRSVNRGIFPSTGGLNRKSHLLSFFSRRKSK
ncbi:MAG: DUF2179 domain-containing protein [Planctomycetota bacterium]|nr:DUF2179 domain-containing protein [Planctomycetota bacterium]